MKLLLDPRFFDYVIITLYCLNAIRWGVSGRLAETCYWICAMGIQSTVTFLFPH